MTASQAIRGTISGGGSPCSEETLAALNCLVGNKAHFLLNDTNALVVVYPNETECALWCNHMNVQLFPNEKGYAVRMEEDSAAQALGLAFRFPESFYHLISYIADGKVFYNQPKNKWHVTEEMQTEGQWEIGHEREQFEAWMQRQIARIENGVL